MDNNYENVPDNQDAAASPVGADSSSEPDMDCQSGAEAIDNTQADTVSSPAGDGADQQTPVYTDPNAGQQQDISANTSADTQHVSANPPADQIKDTYTDPNAGQQQTTYAYQNGEQTPLQDNQSRYDGYRQAGQQQQQNGYGYNSQRSGGYQQYGGNPVQDNYNYNVGNNTGYHSTYDTGMDNSPLSMGDWVLTILALMIPCAGIVLYFVWAFGKNGNVNRRNYCRASLIITGVSLVLYLILLIVFGFAMIGPLSGYY